MDIERLSYVCKNYTMHFLYFNFHDKILLTWKLNWMKLFLKFFLHSKNYNDYHIFFISNHISKLSYYKFYQFLYTIIVLIIYSEQKIALHQLKMWTICNQHNISTFNRCRNKIIDDYYNLRNGIWKSFTNAKFTIFAIYQRTYETIILGEIA